MTIEKTAQGVLALEERNQISPKARQMLILCNGKRNVRDLAAIFGDGTMLELLQLEARGLLRGVSAEKKSAVAAPAASAADLAPRARNRSLAACKVYMTDLLQLQQDDNALQIGKFLRGSTDTQEMLELILVGLDLIMQRSGERYLERVAQRVFEIVPDDALALFVRLAVDIRIPALELIARRYEALLEPA